MKTFIDFCGETKKELPVYQQDENTKRSALAHWMAPPQSARGNYPASYFLPIQADALFKLGKDAK